MAQILSFRTPEFRTSDRSRREGRSADVILFPGIRYERWSEPDASPVSEQHSKSRDVLELVE